MPASFSLFVFVRCFFGPIGIGFALAGCVAVRVSPLDLPPQKTTLAADRVKLPTSTEETGMLYVEARINGAGPFRLVVDTGASALALTQRVAEAAGVALRPNLEVLAGNAAGGKVSARFALVERFESGGLVLEGVGSIVVDDSDLAAFNTLTKADGILGLNALKDVVLEMDFPGKQVTVARLGTLNYPVDRAVNYTETRPAVTIDVAGKPTPVMIDTGSNGTLTLPTLDNLPLLTPIVRSTGAGAVLGKSTGPRGVTSQLAGEAKLGPLVWENPPLVGAGNHRSYGLLGVQALNHGTLVVNQRERRIYFLGETLRRSWEEEKPGDPRFELGFFGEIEGGGVRLLEVDSGGAADLAGLRAGDLLLTMNDTPAASPTIMSYRTRVRVQRDGREFDTTLVHAPDYAPRQTILVADRVVLPTAKEGRGPLVVEARIGEAGPFRFLVSSRLRALGVGQHVAEAAKLNAMPEWTVGGRASTAKVVWVEQFAAGGLELKGMAANVLDSAALANANALFGSIDGFLGMEALKEVVIELDFPKRQAIAVRPGTENYPEDRTLAYRGLVLSGALDIEGRSVPVAIDTASTANFELPMLGELKLLYPLVKTDSVGVGRTSMRSERGQLAGEAKLGPVTWARPPISRRTVARIGAGALGGWRLAIDQGARKIYFLDGNLRRTATEARPPEAGFKAGYYARMEDGALRLVEVDGGGAFERAGLRAGDLVLSVDGKPGPEYVRTPGFFSARNNPRPKLRVLRDGAEFDAEVSLAPDETPQQINAPALR